MSGYRKRTDERGAAAVEFALIAPVLLVLLFGIIDFGLAINRYAMVNNAAREAAREASLGATDAEIRAVVTNRLSGMGTPTVTIGCKRKDNTTCTSWTAGKESGGIAIVSVRLDYTWLTPVAGLLGAGSSQPVSKTTSMRIE